MYVPFLKILLTSLADFTEEKIAVFKLIEPKEGIRGDYFTMRRLEKIDNAENWS